MTKFESVSKTSIIDLIGIALETGFNSAKQVSELMGADEETLIAQSRATAYLPSNSITNANNLDDIIKHATNKIESLLEEIKNENSADLFLQIGRCYYIIGDFPNTYASFISASRYDPEKFTNSDWYYFGSLHQHFTGDNKALECFSKVDQGKLSKKQLKDFKMRFAISYRHSKKTDFALQLFNSLLNDPPEKLTKEDILLQIAMTHYKSLRIEDSFNQIQSLLKTFPNNQYLIREKVIHQFLTCTTQDLNSILPEILDVYKQYPDYYIQLVLARIYYFLGSYLVSYEYFKGCLDFWSDHPPFWVALGLLYFQNRQHDHAAVAFQRAIYMKQTSRSAWLNLGLVFEEKRELENAINIYRTGAKQCNHPDFINRINRKGESNLIEVDDNDLLEQVPEMVEKKYLRTIPVIDTKFIGKNRSNEFIDPLFQSLSIF
ncbi:TPR Domain containing protein [Trichomonas vaginalis G3]|uniref:TPR Domain containing protein n=1 Tax=Trichomonas vaginalis (strain ATCC PRA-98 / G3) TaxID=412133 RepID=A2DML3_TRIV3|nr:cellular component assembly [Trichomonas vaginalis G3]EAY18440.1 TPR Domain containing protein [Trichomonas vaginalis G3]KAI5530281.1 cellular component assembly [Trichomonas vaginalis G3]|eukprot:XP_001579426.1 TPR Domain containing protein [Trichomonas vaginalis G3]